MLTVGSRAFVALAAAAIAAPLVRPAAGDLSVVAIGDWGGHNDEEPTTESQRLTAIGLRRKAVELNASFAMLMGDNFYSHGISSDDTSSRFRDTFEAVYAKLLPGRPFYAFAGNHDYGEGVLANVSAQIAYSKRSAQWHFPSLWYKIHRDFEAGGQARSLDVLVLDTVVLCGNGEENEGFIDEELRFLGDAYLDTNGNKSLTRRQVVAEAHWAWLETELAASKADYLWVAGHYPIWSAGNDGSQQCLIDRLRPLLVRHGAHYISGHDHMLEHFVYEGLNTFVVGAGKECCYSARNLDTIPPNAMQYMLAGHLGSESRPPAPFPVRGGFASMVFGSEAARIALHAHDGTVLYFAPPIARRSGVHRGTPTMDQVEQLAAPLPPSALLILAGGLGAAASAAAAVAVFVARKRCLQGTSRAASRPPSFLENAEVAFNSQPASGQQ